MEHACPKQQDWPYVHERIPQQNPAECAMISGLSAVSVCCSSAVRLVLSSLLCMLCLPCSLLSSGL